MTPINDPGADAAMILADWGKDLVCAAVPAVTRGLVDDAVQEHRFEDGTSVTQVTILKVARGAFGTTRVKDTRVTIAGRSATYSIDGEVPHETSLFDAYALQPVRTRSAT